MVIIMGNCFLMVSFGITKPLSAFSPQQLCFQNIFKICSPLSEIIVSTSSMGNIFTAAENGVQTVLSALHGWGNIEETVQNLKMPMYFLVQHLWQLTKAPQIFVPVI